MFAIVVELRTSVSTIADQRILSGVFSEGKLRSLAIILMGDEFNTLLVSNNNKLEKFVLRVLLDPPRGELIIVNGCIGGVPVDNLQTSKSTLPAKNPC